MSLTITRALSRVSVIEKRLSALRGQTFVKSTLKSEVDSTRSKDFEKQSKSLWDEFNSLLNEYQKLKVAIKRSNQQTKVKISGVEMTVEEAIIRKDSSKLEAEVLEVILHQNISTDAEIINADSKIEASARSFAEKLSRDNSSKEDLEHAVEIGRASATREFKRERLAGFDVKEVNEKRDFHLKFLEEVDYILSESNAITMIEI